MTGCAVITLFSQTNLWHVSAQGLEMFKSGLYRIPILLKKLEVCVIWILQIVSLWIFF